MDSPFSPAILLFIFLLVSSSPNPSVGLDEISTEQREEGIVSIGRRHLMSFKETPIGTNITYDCSPSGPCVPCTYSEKNDEKYRCSETGYRIPFKCVEIKASSKEVNSNKGNKNRSALEDTYAAVRLHVMKHNGQALTSSVRERNLLDDSSTSKSGSHAYVTYRSCVLSVNEEKLSVLGFEVLMLGLLIVSGSTIYFRKRRAAAAPGAGPVRLPNNSRF
ncbi:uncharacterized protein LOC107768235 [Nicotiana tabacum]|uniref:Uncharacterized protein LOC107768235 n=1 Tax=Nicotiana tabacum TaxID=4097 RepID=A0A1S3XS96_TOBAC|nr:PREDICTED: uncharacterized protein LOC107768235 [Nicotiana tabacum]